MKKFSALFLALLLALTFTFALADAPEKGSLSITHRQVVGNYTFTLESYPEVWISPIFYQYIVEGKEDYPAHFLRFPLPDGATATEFGYDDCYAINFDTMLSYGYYAYDRMSFEVFLEKAEEGSIIADGSEGVAMYVNSDSRRAYGMIDIKEQFGKTSRLVIEIYDHSGNLSQDARKEQIVSEVARVQASMAVEELTGYWSEGVFATVELYESRDPITALVDTSSMTLYDVDDSTLKAVRLEDGKSKETQIAIDSNPFALYKQEQGEETWEANIDGRDFTLYHGGLKGYACTLLMEEGRSGKQYLIIEIEGDQETFEAMVKETFALITVTVGEQ